MKGTEEKGERDKKKEGREEREEREKERGGRRGREKGGERKGGCDYCYDICYQDNTHTDTDINKYNWSPSLSHSKTMISSPTSLTRQEPMTHTMTLSCDDDLIRETINEQYE